MTGGAGGAGGAPFLTASLWDPVGAADLSARVDRSRAAAALPTGADQGDLPGCVHVWVRAGDLGLGVPEDRPGAWAEVGRALGELVLAVRPAWALAGVEWAAEGLLDPDRDVLAPGLSCGWVAPSAGPVRSERFDRLLRRGAARPLGGGTAWAARGAVSLDGDVEGDPDELADQVFWAWTGASPDESVAAGRLQLGVPLEASVAEETVAAALPAGYEVLGVSGGTAVAREPTWAGAPAHTLAEACVLVDARWGVVQRPVHGGSRGPVALWVPASRPGLVDQVTSLVPDAVWSTDPGGSLVVTDGGPGAVLAAEWLRRS